ncbi:MAG: serine/threonine-protein kinase [Planctomycetota bacterium]
MKEISRAARKVFEQVLDDSQTYSRESVDDLCNGDAELVAEVNSLLDAYDAADSILESPLGADSIRPDLRPKMKVGDRVNRYRLSRLIGSGGFGQVFEAEQKTPVRREVAIKLIKPGMASDEVLKRFEVERQNLALLNHPNIANILDVGSNDSGNPFFVMELVRGTDICSFCDEHKLSVRQRVELLIEVCEAVQYAHRRGVIHRDLKPANVLVGGSDGGHAAKIIDFGISKVLRLGDHDPAITGDRTLVGTPLFMSPEQARYNADVDTRTDVYSLGGVLYQLLTGSAPIDLDSPRDTPVVDFREIIQQEKPVRPSQRVEGADGVVELAATRSSTPREMSRQLSGELDWIVLKAIEKDPSRRYQAASDFADDLRSWLSGDVVKARPTSLLYRTKKFVRRNRLLVAATSLIALTLIGATVFSLRMARLKDRESEKATEMARLKEIESNRAADSTEDAWTVSNVLVGALELPDAESPQGQSTPVYSGYDEVIDTLRGNELNFPGVTAHLCLVTGLGYSDLEFYEESIWPLEKFLELAELPADDLEVPRANLPSLLPADKYNARSRLAFAYAKTFQLDKAEDLAGETLEQIASEGVKGKYPFCEVWCYLTLARAAFYSADTQASESHIANALVVAQSHPILEMIARREQATVRTTLSKREAYAIAVENYKFAVNNFGVESFPLMQARHSLGKHALAVEDFAVAIGSFKQNLPLLERALATEHPLVTSTLYYLVIATRNSRDMRESERYLKSAEKRYVMLENPSFTLSRLRFVARAWFCRGKLDEDSAFVNQLKAVEYAGLAYGEGSRSEISEKINLLTDYAGARQYEKAEQLLDELEPWIQDSGEASDQIKWSARWYRFRCLVGLEEFEAAENAGIILLAEAGTFSEQDRKRWEPLILLRLGRVCAFTYRPREAVDYFTQAIERSAPHSGFSLRYSAETSIAAGMFNEAVEFAGLAPANQEWGDVAKIIGSIGAILSKEPVASTDDDELVELASQLDEAMKVLENSRSQGLPVGDFISVSAAEDWLELAEPWRERVAERLAGD